MPVFEIEKGGKTFEIDAPDEASALAAFGGQSYKGGVLPFSKDASGGVSFDPDAGILGAVKRAVTLPGRVAAGDAKLPSSGSVPGSVPFGDQESAGAEVADLATMAAPVNPAIRAGDRAVPGMLRALKPRQPDVPSATALKEAADRGYQSARDMGVDYSSGAVKSLFDGVERELFQAGAIDETAPKTFAILRKLQNPPDGSVASISGLDAARQALGAYALDPGKEGFAAKQALRRLDEFLTSPPEAAVVAGPAAEAGAEIASARGNLAAAKRSSRLTGELDRAFTGAEERADLNAAVANSGQNIDNALRQRVRDILVNPKKIAGYSEDEIAALERVARGTPLSNAARFTGNLLGGGGGMGAMLTSAMGAGGAAAATGSPMAAMAGAMAPVAGMGSKKLANYLTRKSLDAADESVRMRSPLYEQLSRDAPMFVEGPEKRAALLRMLMMSAPQGSQ